MLMFFILVSNVSNVTFYSSQQLYVTLVLNPVRNLTNASVLIRFSYVSNVKIILIPVSNVIVMIPVNFKNSGHVIIPISSM